MIISYTDGRELCDIRTVKIKVKFAHKIFSEIQHS